MIDSAPPILDSAIDIFAGRFYGLALAVVQRLDRKPKNELLLTESVTGDWRSVRPDTDVVALAFKDGKKREFWAGRFIDQRPSPRFADLFELVVDRFEPIGVHDLSLVPDAAFYGNKGGGGSRVYVTNEGHVVSPDNETDSGGSNPPGGSERRDAWIRKNHRQFRDKVWLAWSGRCAVTGAECNGVLIASHIWPWSRSNPQQKTEPDNGLLLASPLDALFDRGLIGFADDGQIIVASKLQPETGRIFAITQGARLTRVPSRRMREFLKMHRELFGL